MPHPSKRKGDGFEREVVDFLRQHGVPAERIPLSGAVKGGSFEGDITLPIHNTARKIECKRRRRAFSTLYGWLGENFGLVVRDDRTEPLVVIRLKDFAGLV